MSIASTRAPTTKKIRYVRDSKCRLVEIREFDFNAELGNYCHSTVIKRDSITKAIIGSFTKKEVVVQQDLDDTSE